MYRTVILFWGGYFLGRLNCSIPENFENRRGEFAKVISFFILRSL